MAFSGKYAPGKSPTVLLKEFARTTLQKALEWRTTNVEISPLNLTDLPAVMRKMGWQTAPKLMEKWFNGEAYILTGDEKDKHYDDPLSIPKEQLCEDIVKMEWALQFARIASAHDSLLKNIITTNSVERLKWRLMNFGRPIEAPRLGDAAMSARELDACCQIQRQSFGDEFDEPDDLYGALGKASIYLGVVGYVRRGPGTRTDFVVEGIGTYIKDIYEFNGYQLLGLWTQDRVLGQIETIFTLADPLDRAAFSVAGENIIELNEIITNVKNSDFEQYRLKYQKGGDFIIYSDVHWNPVPNGLCIPLNKEEYPYLMA